MTFMDETRANLQSKSTLALRIAALWLSPRPHTYEHNFAMNVILDELQHRLPPREYTKFYDMLLERSVEPKDA